MPVKKKLAHITGLKGISCLLIMLGHLFAVYKYAQVFEPRILIADRLWNSSISFLIDEGYWVYLFFVVSGYLVSKSKINSVTGIVTKSISRFFRFAFPILFSYLVIYLIYVFIGFYNAETTSVLSCMWLQQPYADGMSLLDVLRSPIDVLLFGRVDLNSSYWVLRDMLIASLLIYVLMYCYRAFSEKQRPLCFSALMLLCIVLSQSHPVIAACIAGMIVSVCEETENLLSKSYFAFWAILLAFAICIFSTYTVCIISFALLIVLIPRVEFLNRILSSKALCFLGDISWGVFSFHIPLICSVGALMIIKLHSAIGLLAAYGLCCLAVIAATLLLSVLYYYSFEKLTNSINRKIDSALKKLAK